MVPIPKERPRAYVENLVLQYPNATQEEAPGIIYAIAFAVVANINNLLKALEFLLKIGGCCESVEPSQTLRHTARTVLALHILPMLDPAEKTQQRFSLMCLEFFSHWWHASELTDRALDNLRFFTEACYKVIDGQRHKGVVREEYVFDPKLVMAVLVSSRHHALLRSRRSSEALIPLMSILARDASRPICDGDKFDRSRAEFYCHKAIDYGCRVDPSQEDLEKKEMAITALAIMFVSPLGLG